MQRLKNAWRRRPIITSAFLLAVLLTGLFAFRSITFMVYWSNPNHQNQPIQAWMTPRYIAQSWHLSRPVLYEALGTDEMPGRRATLSDIAHAQGVPVAELVSRVAEVASAYQDTQK